MLGVKPPSKALYKLNQMKLQKFKRLFNKLFKRGYIRPNKSLSSAPVLFVNKNDDKFQMSIDYKTLNKITIKNNYPLLRINDLLNKLIGAKVSTKYISNLVLIKSELQRRIIRKWFVRQGMIPMTS